MKIEYKIHEIAPNIFAVAIEDDYDLAMTFCRAQEYYESPNPDFRGNQFSIWEFMDWYSRKRNGSFTYPSDWGGFNVPFDVLNECYLGLREIESPYDVTMIHIISSIRDRMSEGLAYVIGVPDLEGSTFIHEVCHGLYYTNHEYKETANKITEDIRNNIPETYHILSNNLKSMGYTEGVIDDEIQAYLTTNWDHSNFGRSIDNKVKRKLHKEYNKKLEKFLI